MAALDTPPGITVEEPPLSIGSPDVLVAVPVGSNYIPADEAGPTTPTTGQIWPRGQGA